MSTPRSAPASSCDFAALVAGLGHDLRGAIGVIVGASELLLEEIAEEEGREAWRGDLRGIHASGKKLCTISEALVDLARIESHDAPVTPAPAALASVVEGAIAEHGPRGARLEVVRTGEALTVSVDAPRLRRAVALVLDAVSERAGADAVTVSVTGKVITFAAGSSGPQACAEDARIAIARLLCARLGVDLAQRGGAVILTVRGGDAPGGRDRGSPEGARDSDDLERLVAERTAALREVNAALRHSNGQLDGFARTVAHDLKQPLNALLGCASLLATEIGEMPAAEAAELARAIESRGRKMAEIVNALLLLARAHERHLLASPLDMRAVVAGALEIVRGAAEARGAVIVVPDAFPPALGYAPWIESVWVNYLSNGIKYGGDPPRLELGAIPAGAGKVRFFLRDNGPGLSEAAQAQLFQPFTRLAPERGEGHGLGLSIVRRIVEELGGEVGLESAPGKGSVFSFTLPVP